MSRHEQIAADSNSGLTVRGLAHPVLITALVSGLAAWTFAGCQTGSGQKARASRAGEPCAGGMGGSESSASAAGCGSIEQQSSRGAIDSQIVEMNRTADAQERAADAEARHRNELLAAQLLEWKSTSDRLTAQAAADWSSAQSEHARMLAERAGMAERGNAQIAQMERTMRVTAERSAANVRALRSQAMAASDRAAADAARVAQEIASLKERSEASILELTQRAAAVAAESGASAREFESRAASAEERSAGESIRLVIKAAEAEFEQAKAEANRLFQAAAATKQLAAGEGQKRKMLADRARDLDETDYQASLAAIQNFIDHGKAEIALKRAKADKIEKDARAEFVRARAEAGARVVVGGAAKQYAMAEEEAKRIAAEAEAEAARVRADHSRASAAAASPDERAPAMQRVAPSTPVVAPEQEAKFRAALAEAEKLRVQCEADEMAMFGAAGERASAFEAWWQQQLTKHQASVAEAAGASATILADASRQSSEAEIRLRAATIRFERAKAEAEATRQESLASVAAMRAEAELVRTKGAAVSAQMSAEVEAKRRNAESELRSLTVICQTTRERGEAACAALNARADSLERSQAAVVSQMEQEITGARGVLEGELASLDQGAESFLTVAKGEYDGASAIVETMAKLVESSTVQMVAANQAERQMAQADVEYLREVSNAGRLAAEAAAARAAVDAGQEQTQEEFFASIGPAQERTRSGFASAGLGGFDMGIIDRPTLAQGERERALVAQYFENDHGAARAHQLVAAAEAYRERSRQALARISSQAGSFQSRARENWASAFTGTLPVENPIQQDPDRQGPALVDVPSESASRADVHE